MIIQEKKPSKKRIARDIAKLKAIGINAYEQYGYIVVIGDIVYKKQTIEYPSIFQYVKFVHGNLDFHGVKKITKYAFQNLAQCENLFFTNLTELPKFAFPSLIQCRNLYFQNLRTLKKCSFKAILKCGSFYPKNIKKDGEPQFKWVEKSYDIEEGYYPEYRLAYFDGIVKCIENVRKFGEYTFYMDIDGEYIVQNGKYTAHGTTLKTAISDLLFKIQGYKFKDNYITSDTVVTAELYRAITGSWTVAIQNFIRKHGLKEGIKARKLLQILESENIYGAKYFKEAIKD
jgi:hypothetical protein